MLRRNVHAALYTILLIASFVGAFVASISIIESRHLHGAASMLVLFLGATLLSTIPTYLYRRVLPASCVRCGEKSFIVSAGKRLVYKCRVCGDSSTW